MDLLQANLGTMKPIISHFPPPGYAAAARTRATGSIAIFSSHQYWHYAIVRLFSRIEKYSCSQI